MIQNFSTTNNCNEPVWSRPNNNKISGVITKEYKVTDFRKPDSLGRFEF